MIVPVAALLVLGAVLIYVLRDHSHEREDWAKERRLLLTRIQAPETVTPELDEDAPMPRAVHPDIDEDYWEAREQAGVNGNS